MADRKFERNRIHNANNPCQGEFKRVLCVCSAGLLRSPTAAKVLGGDPFNFNTRAAGAEESFALVPVDNVLLYWADEVVCMTQDHAMIIKQKFPEMASRRNIIVLGIEDDYEFMEPQLVEMIKNRYTSISDDLKFKHDVNCGSIIYGSSCDCKNRRAA